MKFLLMFDSSVTLKCFLQYKINVVFLAEAFRIKEFKLKNLVLFKSKNWIGEYLCQMSSCSKIVRKSDEVSHYIIWFDILYVVSVLLYHFPYIICLNKKYVAQRTSMGHLWVPGTRVCRSDSYDLSWRRLLLGQNLWWRVEI